MFNKAERIREYLREEMLPSIFCSGCGNGNVLNYTLRAIDELRIDIDKVVFISGIGCSSRLPGYIDADGLHTTHGRAIAFATGVK
ncbi:MAG: 2-oxoacid:ferredoxin oxidoreductase subunit beta, partial [Gemmatimonadota bacterium]